MYTKKKIQAGDLVIETLYPSFHKWDTPEARRWKRGLRSKANRAKNDKTARRRALLYLAHNFRQDRASVATFTFSDQWQPRSYREVSGRMEFYLRKLRTRARKRDGEPLKYLYVIEHRHGEGRFHVHMVWNIPMGEKAAALALWPYGTRNNQEMKPLERDASGGVTWEALAAYLTKEAQEDRPVGAYMWHKSRNVVFPKEETEQVPDSYVLRRRLPRAAFVLEHEEQDRPATGGRYEYVMYRLPVRKMGQQSGRKRQKPRRK